MLVVDVTKNNIKDNISILPKKNELNLTALIIVIVAVETLDTHTYSIYYVYSFLLIIIC